MGCLIQQSRSQMRILRKEMLKYMDRKSKEASHKKAAMVRKEGKYQEKPPAVPKTYLAFLSNARSDSEDLK